MVFDSHGDIGASSGGPDGLFSCDTRYLSHFELLINGLQPLLLGSNLSDDNGGPHRRSHQPRHLLRQAHHPAERPSARGADGLHLALDALSPLRRAKFRHRAGPSLAVGHLRQRFRRHLRSARHAARAARQHAQPRRARSRGVRLSRPRRQEPPHQHRVRADADASVAVARLLSARSRSPRVGFALQHGFVRRRRTRATAVPEKPALHAPRAQADDQGRHRDRHLESSIQRGAAPIDRRSGDPA